MIIQGSTLIAALSNVLTNCPVYLLTPTTLDIWPYHWLTLMPGALPDAYIFPIHFLKVFAWVARFRRTVKAAEGSKPKPLKGDEPLKLVNGWEFAEAEGELEEGDPTWLRKGDLVEVWPIETGFNPKDRGRLVVLNGEEILIESRTQIGESVRVHTPRHGFRLKSVEKETRF